jgi:signal transduction histidine kinase
MEIRDNGCSFRVGTGDANPTRKRLGLLGIEERVRLVDGKFHVDSAPGRGTRIAIWIPFQLEAVDHC